jgi:hypothetical protein
MSDTVDNVLNYVQESEPTDDVVVSEATEEVSEAPVEEKVEESPVEESPVEEETEEKVEEEAPVEEKVEEATEEKVKEAPVEETPVEEAPVEEETEEKVEEAEEQEEAPVEEAPVEEAPVEEATEEKVEEAPVEEAQEEKPMEQVVSDIRDILSEEPVAASEKASASEAGTVVTDNLCSLKTLVDVLGKWAGNEIKKMNVEDLLKEGSEVDKNLDDVEKVVEILQIWIKEDGSIFRGNNHFKNLDEYTLSGESRNLSEEKKVDVLKTVTELVVNVSQRKVTNEEIQNVMDSLY